MLSPAARRVVAPGASVARGTTALSLAGERTCRACGRIRGARVLQTREIFRPGAFVGLLDIELDFLTLF